MKKVILKKNHLTLNSSSYITDYLSSLGIKPEDVPSFIGTPRNEDEEDPRHLDNINQAITALIKGANAKKKFFVQVDSDTDGFTSGAIIINYLRRRYPDINLTWRLHNGKEHGVIVDTVPEDADIVIIPDAGSNQFNEQEKLVELGKVVIIIDHHQVTDLDRLAKTPAIIVNNQLSPAFKNKDLSGAGVVYKVIKEMDKVFGDKIYKDYGDLAAIGIIADAMNMNNIDNNYLAYYGLKNIHSQFIKALAVKQARNIKDPDNLTKINVAWSIAPIINGVIRGGTPEDKQMVFRALTEENSTEQIPHTWRGVTNMENLYDCAVRLAANAKSRQDSQKKKAFEWICEEIRKKELDKHNIIIVTLDEKQSTKVSANLTGLIAMELVKEFNRPCLVLRKTEYDGKQVFGGSGRNGTFHELPDLKSMLQQAGAYYAEGHANAHGVFLLPEQVNDIVKYFDEHLDPQSFNDTYYEVDYWFHTGEELDVNMLEEMASYDSLWGNSIPQPKFAIDANFSMDQVVTCGADSNTLKIRLGNIECIAFKAGELIAELSRLGRGHITIVGRSQINDYNGWHNIQIAIDDIAISSINENKVDLSSLI